MNIPVFGVTTLSHAFFHRIEVFHENELIVNITQHELADELSDLWKLLRARQAEIRSPSWNLSGSESIHGKSYKLCSVYCLVTKSRGSHNPSFGGVESGATEVCRD